MPDLPPPSVTINAVIQDNSKDEMLERIKKLSSREEYINQIVHVIKKSGSITIEQAYEILAARLQAINDVTYENLAF